MRIVIITQKIPARHGGRSAFLLMQAHQLAERGHEVVIFTNGYWNGISMEKASRKIHEREKINPGIQFKTVYEDYAELPREAGAAAALTRRTRGFTFLGFLRKEFGIRIGLVEMARYFLHREEVVKKNGYRIKFKYGNVHYPVKAMYLWREDDAENQRFSLSLRSRGWVHRLRRSNADTGWIFEDTLYNCRQCATMHIGYREDGANQWGHREVTVLKGGAGGEDLRFETYKDFVSTKYEEYLKDDDVVINHVRFADEIFLNMKRKRPVFYQLHNSHLSDPADPDSETKRSYFTLLSGKLGQRDRILAPTVLQRNLILSKFPHQEGKVIALPHPKKLFEIKYNVDLNKIVIVSRIDFQKRIEDAVDAFCQIAGDYPNHSLYIYGTGDMKDELEKRIGQSGLTDRVFLMGFTDDPGRAFQEAAFSVVSSRYEGFCLTVLESISNGCPVVSYDIMFGPSEIGDESCVVITKENTPEALAAAMRQEIEHPHDRNRAVARSEHFSLEKWTEAWMNLIAEAGN